MLVEKYDEEHVGPIRQENCFPCIEQGPGDLTSITGKWKNGENTGNFHPPE